MLTIQTASASRDVLTLPIGVSTDEIVGLLQVAVHRPHCEPVSLVSLGRVFHSDDDRLLAAVKVAQVLGFAELSGAELELTPAGRAFAVASSRNRKKLFAEQLQRVLPWVKLIKSRVAGDPRQRVMLADLAAEFMEFNPDSDIEKGLLQVTDWGRYAGLFDYDSRTRHLSLAIAQRVAA
jgi:NitT/TauT family transport system ATP-binding protein